MGLPANYSDGKYYFDLHYSPIPTYYASPKITACREKSLLYFIKSGSRLYFSTQKIETTATALK